MKCHQALCFSLVIIAVAAFSTVVIADQISLNFSENSNNQFFDGGQLIGPLHTDSSNWNNTNGQPDLFTGSMTDLIDDSGANTGASVTWAASNVYWNTDGTADDEHRMAVGYLDDGETSTGIGVDITFDNIPYARYRVYGLVANGDSGEYDTLDFMVNGTSVFGAATAPAYGGIDESMTQTGQFWSHADGTNRGNYWTIDTTGSTLTVTGLPRNGAERGSITAVIVEEIPEPVSLGLLGLAAFTVFAYSVRRR